MEIISDIKCYDGRQLRIKHFSTTCQCNMHFSLFLPALAQQKPVPLLTWLSGLTCTDENFVTKAGAQQFASEEGVAIVAPDTSPRGEDVPDGPEKQWDIGVGAGFYVDATEIPWNDNYQMYSYVSIELPDLLKASDFNLDMTRQGIFGHSMGGHGALTIALKNPHNYRSVSAFAPICSPMKCMWGEKALGQYLGTDKRTWTNYDACELIKLKGCALPVLVDQGTEDPFLVEQLKPELLVQSCQESKVALQLRMQQAYDHSYFFISSFIRDHIKFHVQNLRTVGLRL